MEPENKPSVPQETRRAPSCWWCTPTRGKPHTKWPGGEKVRNRLNEALHDKFHYGGIICDTLWQEYEIFSRVMRGKICYFSPPDPGLRHAEAGGRADALRKQTKGSKWGPNGIAAMGQMGINRQLVDVIYTCSEGWEGPEIGMLKRLPRPVY